ncbi:Na(+)/H(+) exchange regulatory cofactor NHE-RF2 isoform X2 [Loxodonta africana]|uniref:Na(+)/H(+) exchange regulatory cofactor NHE-RF2 isoform X2 n=1 Tax=Loxodonta africana TaxID=9785 RepID=UPI0030D604D9
MAGPAPLRPRLCRLVRGELGYGFHLHGEKGRRGQFVRRVEPGSPAEAAALRAGDRLIEVNGVNVEGETHHQVVQRIKAVEGQTQLLVVDKETDEELRRRQLTCTEEMAQQGLPPTHDPWEPKQDWVAAGNLGSEAGGKVNGQNVEQLRHAEVVASIKAHKDEAWLLVVDLETDKHFKRLRVTPTEEHVQGLLPSSISNGTSPAQFNGGSVCSSRSDLPGLDKDVEDGSTWKRDPFQESGLHLSPTAAEAKEKARAMRVNKQAPQMDWNRKREIFSNF